MIITTSENVLSEKAAQGVKPSTVRLSDAILKGVELRSEQFFGWYWGYHYDPFKNSTTVGSCAMGAAYDGAKGKVINFDEEHRSPIDVTPVSELWALFPQLLTEVEYPTGIVAGINFDLPHNRSYRDTLPLNDLILLLNDRCRLTREQIAAYLAEQGY